MALFSKKTEDEKTDVAAVPATAAVVASPVTNSRMVLLPRLSEKAYALNKLNKYVFKIGIKDNKIEVRKAVEKQYGVKVARVNMVRMEGKPRRYGRTSGKMQDFKKAIVTLTPGSKKIDTVEAA